MGYALFAQRKLVLDSQLNSAQLQQTQRSDEQYALATQKLSLGQQLSSLQASQSKQLSAKYAELAHVADGDSANTEDVEERKDTINAEIKSMEEDFQGDIDDINRSIYEVSVQENAIEMEVKRLDTMVTALQKQLEAVEEAEGDAIDRATPKYNGV